MSQLIWGWLGAMVVFGVVEALTAGLVSIWFVVGSAAALVCAALGTSLQLQLAAFAVVSAIALAVTRPLVKRFARPAAVATNADRVLGGMARVTETIDNESSSGAVYIDGKTWTARSAEGTVIPEGTMVRVEQLEGVKLLVKTCEKTEVVK